MITIIIVPPWNASYTESFNSVADAKRFLDALGENGYDVARNILGHTPDGFAYIKKTAAVSEVRLLREDRMELLDLLRQSLNSLEYVKDVAPNLAGWGVRQELIEKIRLEIG